MPDTVRDTGLDVVTGAFSYTGRAIAGRLLAAGRRVRTLTGHPRPDDPLAARVEARPYDFGDPLALAAALSGATTFYNTYWVRFPRGPVNFAGAVANSRMLFLAARQAGARRIVHISIANPSTAVPLPYFRGKAEVERALVETDLPYTIVRPTVVFGPGDVLVNNIAWLLRRFPVFAIPGSGDYQVRPVHVDDVARLCVDGAGTGADVMVDAVGPERMSFRDMVRTIRDAVGSRSKLISVPAATVPAMAGVLGRVVDDVLLTRDELAGLRAGLVDVEGPATGSISFSEWVAEHGATLGRTYASELARHFDRPPGRSSR
jgi:uncharacterized protein YbjT (DUF2867 family)